jgi:hypothetical protein
MKYDRGEIQGLLFRSISISITALPRAMLEYIYTPAHEGVLLALNKMKQSLTRRFGKPLWRG